MIDRRMFSALLAAALTAPRACWAQPKMGATMFYASVGPELGFYHVDADGIELSRQGSLTLPANVQYAWPHPSANILYATWSNGGPGVAGDEHGASALSIDPGTGALRPHGPSAALRSRPIHISIDESAGHALIAHNDPSGITVLQINGDGSIGDEVKQRTAPDVGIFAHQIRVMPSGKAVILVTRGNDPAAGKPEDPGALKIFSFEDGQLTNRASIAPGGGYGFGPRHLDFHPSQPWVYVSLERQNKVDVFRIQNDSLDPQPIFSKDTLAEPGNLRPRQLAGTVHLHPNGRYVYVANRSDAMNDFQGKQVYLGGKTTSPYLRSTAVPASRRLFRTWTRTDFIRGPSRSTRADACWSPPISPRDSCVTEIKCDRSRQHSPPIASVPTASSRSHARMMSRQVASISSGAEWWRCGSAGRGAGKLSKSGWRGGDSRGAMALHCLSNANL